MIHCIVHNSIEEIDSAAWNEIVPDGSIFQSYEALLFIEKKGLPEYTPKYFVFKNKHQQIIAHTTAYIIKTDLLIFSKGFIKKTATMIRKSIPGFLYSEILECGIPVSLGNPIIMREGLDKKALFRHLNASLKAVAKAHGVQLMVLRDFYDRDSTLFPFLAAAGFQMINNLPTTELEIRWRDFESYVGSMRSNFRSKLKRHRRIAAQSRFTASFVSDFSDLGTQLSAQWKNVNKEAKEYSREQLSPDFYTHINAGLKGKCRLLKIIQGDTLVAHALIAIDGSILRWLFFGRETKGTRDGAYFFAMEQIIQLAMKLEMKRIEMGLTCYSAKTDYGAKVIPLHMFVQCRNGLLNHIVPRLYNCFNRPGSLQDRNVFNE